MPHPALPPTVPADIPAVVRTKLDEDGKPIPARAISISIRCYQSRLTRSRNFRSTLVADLTDVLWQKPPDKDYADVAEMEFPFKLTLPKRTPGFSTANYQDYRIFWRLEAGMSSPRSPRLPQPAPPLPNAQLPPSYLAPHSAGSCGYSTRRLPHCPLLRPRPRPL